ncbi:tetratricopeptide repeat protein (macronuclear) [Tetrahymena thermophila SB210]|uniref:Tetratricopeptide repeat protein 29 n=1 Tax=Tetrahymena thermophila (strain SB210) TaxID=312017 RepID=Q22CH1_TETTS|nr:tetratricopeptide repeat protein [Tetrahymena thermophila SB210]EAR82958.1 tetratricopeptide repeat protein [Tetrahymena thermophila SB210]|eukprot:XP_001030621.1 tetratricopeptide repeat protein [Tetrahymena thermophila SB210]
MFLRKVASAIAKSAVYSRVRQETLLSQQTLTHNKIQLRKIMQFQPSYGFAVISQTQMDEVMQLYTNLRQKPIDQIYSESLKVIKDSNDNIKNYLVFNLITRAALEAKHFDKAIEFSLQQVECLQKEEKKSLQIATCFYDLSILYFQKQKMTMAFQYAFEAEEMVDDLYQDNPKEFEHMYLQVNNNISNLFLHSQNYEKSLDYSNIVVKMEAQDNTQNLLQKFTGLNLQTQAYQAINNDQQAHLAVEKAYILAKKPNLEAHRAYLFATVGYIFSELKLFERAKTVLNESIEIYQKVQGEGSRNIKNLQQKIREIEETEKIQNMHQQTVQPLDQAKINLNQSNYQQTKQQQKNKPQEEPINQDMATTYFKKGMYKEAQAEFEKYIQQIDQMPENERKQYKGTLLNRIFTCQYLQNQYDESLVTALESLQCVIDDNDSTRKAKAFQNVGIAYEKTGDVLKSIEYFQKALNLLDEKTPNLDKYQILVNLMRLHKITEEYDLSVKYGESILNIINSSQLADIEIGRFKAGLSEAYYLNGQFEQSFKMGEKALKIIEKTENGSKQHLYCCYQLLKSYQEEQYLEKIEQAGKKCLELHSKIVGVNSFDEIKYQTYKILANFYVIFGKYDEVMKYLDPLINQTKNSVEYADEYISFLILKAQIQQSLEEYFNALELTKNIFQILKEQSNGRIPFNDETIKLYTLRYQLQYQNINMTEFANSVIEFVEILNRESSEKDYLTEYIIQTNTVINQFIQHHKEEYPEICQKLQKYI